MITPEHVQALGNAAKLSTILKKKEWMCLDNLSMPYLEFTLACSKCGQALAPLYAQLKEQLSKSKESPDSAEIALAMQTVSNSMDRVMSEFSPKIALWLDRLSDRLLVESAVLVARTQGDIVSDEDEKRARIKWKKDVKDSWSFVQRKEDSGENRNEFMASELREQMDRAFPDASAVTNGFLRDDDTYNQQLNTIDDSFLRRAIDMAAAQAVAELIRDQFMALVERHQDQRRTRK